jgi:hypothetical protein
MINDRIVFSLARVRKLHTRAGSPKWSRGRGKVPFFSYVMNTLAIGLIVAGAALRVQRVDFFCQRSAGRLHPRNPWRYHCTLYVLYPKVFQLFAGSQLCPYPARLLAAAGPRFSSILGVPVFGKDLRIWALRRLELSAFRRGSKPSQAFVESFFFSRYLRRKFSNDSLVQRPQFVYREKF